ncbi:MAG: segregation/condensation protein A [Clostridia bacterium]|nr:segregation/condensation protein A [Clostridia bacterium]
MKNDKKEQNLEQVFDTGYQFKLENFEGPLDLLLHLIKDAKMEITEIKLADVTEQYLNYMAGLDELDMDKASDFIDIAATLIEIKSKSLLPRIEEETEEELDPEAMLLRQLKEYKLFKEASERLKQYENVDRFYKAADETVNDYRYVLKEMNIEGLLNAFANMLTRVKKEEEKIVPKKIEKDRFTVAEKIISIRQNILEKKKMRFSDFFEQDYTRSEMINLFLAVLELLKMQEIIVKQQSTYEDIDIELKEKEVLENAN